MSQPPATRFRVGLWMRMATFFSDKAFVARFTWDGQPDAVFGGLGLGYDGGVSGTRSARSCTSLTLSNQMPVCIGDEPRHLQDIGRTRILKFER